MRPLVHLIWKRFRIIPIKTKKFQKLLKNILEKHMAAKKNMLIWSLKLEWELFANKKYYVSSNSFIFGNFINTRRRMYSAMSLWCCTIFWIYCTANFLVCHGSLFANSYFVLHRLSIIYCANRKTQTGNCEILYRNWLWTKFGTKFLVERNEWCDYLFQKIFANFESI